MSADQERWLPIDGWNGYDVSSQGQVRSWWKKGRRPIIMHEPRIMIQNKSGYYQTVRLHRDKQGKTISVHILEICAFKGKQNHPMQCRHLDGNRSNNNIDNLEWGTPRENAMDKIRHGTIKAKINKDYSPFMFFDKFIPIEAIVPWEEWKHIDGLLGYEVSNQGRVRSWWTGRGELRTNGTPKIKSTSSATTCGHQTIRCRIRTGISKSFNVHRLVLETFSPSLFRKLQCRHVDGNARNNHLNNLKWSTVTENIRDQSLHGTKLKGGQCPVSKLSDDQVRAIKKRLLLNESYNRIGKAFGVSGSTIGCIARGETWGHLVI